jgi:PAS domain S-box-containing protein
MDQSIRVLHVEDDPDFADLVSTFLHHEDGRITVRTAASPSDALDILTEHPIDCIVSDYDMPGRNGIELLDAVRDDYPELPFILYTGKGSEEIASDAISAGVTDYLQKGSGPSQYAVLANRIVNAVEKHRAQTDLADRERRLHLFFEQSPVGVVRWDDEFNFAQINAAAEDILGYSEAELVGRSWEVIVPEAERGKVGRDIVEHLLDGEGGYHSINQNVRKDGERIVCEWHNWVLTDDTGDVVSIFSQFRDVSDRRERRQELERYQAIVEAVNNTIITIDESNTIRKVNPAVEDTFGYAPDEIVGEELTVLMSDDVADRHRAAFDRYLETGEKTIDWNAVEFPGQHRDGSTIPLGLSFSELTIETERIFVGIIQDVSERQAREQELRRARERFQTIFEASNDAIFLLDIDDETIVDANPQAEALLGYSRDELLSSISISDIHPNDMDQYRDFLTRIHSKDTGGRNEFQCVTKSGEAKTCEISVSSTDFDDDRYLIAIVRDISERKDYERRLEQFASIISHDLRNPLTVAEGRLQLSQEDCDSRHLEAIERAHERMRSLITDLLTVSREGESLATVEWVDLSSLVTDCWANVGTDAASLVVDTDRSVAADESRLRQVFENVFRNAVEHGGPDVTVTVGELPDGIYVEDDGPGIPDADRERVFEAGYSTSADGTGLGLRIVEEVIEAHDWQIRVTEGSEGGTRFEITGIEFAD